MSELNSQELLRHFQKGDSRAAELIFDRYVRRLLALARSGIGPKLRRRIDADDVVQSAYRSFLSTPRMTSTCWRGQAISGGFLRASHLTSCTDK